MNEITLTRLLYEYEKGQFVVLNEEILSVCLYQDHRDSGLCTGGRGRYGLLGPYVLSGAAEGGAKPYQLLLRAMEQLQRWVVAKLTLRSRESLLWFGFKQHVST